MLSLTREFLRKRYIEEKKTSVEIGKEIGLSPQSVRARLRSLGIPVRTRKEASRLNRNNDVDSVELKRLYKEGQSPRAIAEMLGTTRRRVVGQLERLELLEMGRVYDGEKHWCHGKKLSNDHVAKILESRRRNGSRTGPDPVSVQERFWKFVEKTETCWNWRGAIMGHTYGRIYDARVRSKVLAHRVSWEIHNGSIPDGILVLHKCDNTACVNPAHLFLGNHEDNSIDMVDKGRSKNATMDNATVRYIRKAFSTGIHSALELAQLFGVTKVTIYNVTNGSTYKYVQNEA